MPPLSLDVITFIMKIEIIETSVSLPLELMQAEGYSHEAPQEVIAEAEKGKLWYLLVWRDDAHDSFGFYHIGKAVTITSSIVKDVSVNYMSRAKGTGWVALEASYKNQAGLYPILESKTFRQDAIDWFKAKISNIERVLGLQIKVNDYGPDY